MANRVVASKVNYERLLRAIGRLVQEQGLQDICIVEVEGGFVLQDQDLVATEDGYRGVSNIQLLNHAKLETLASGLRH